RELGPVGLGLADGVVMDLDDQVAAARQRPADAFGQGAGLDAGRPAAEVALDGLARTAEARVTRPRVGLVALPGLAGGVDIRQDVVDHPAVPRSILDRRDIDVLLEPGGDHEASIDVAAPVVLAGPGGHGEIRTDVHDEVGRAEYPFVRV